MTWRPLYNHDWHQCRFCGCTRPTAELSSGELVDGLLNIRSTVYACKDAVLCERLKRSRQEQLARSRGLDPARPIRGRRAAR